MNGDSARRIVALTRQKKAYLAMLKTHDLTLREADALIALCNQEIAALRSQDDLQLSPPGGAPATEAKEALEQGESAQQKPKKA